MSTSGLKFGANHRRSFSFLFFSIDMLSSNQSLNLGTFASVLLTYLILYLERFAHSSATDLPSALVVPIEREARRMPLTTTPVSHSLSAY